MQITSHSFPERMSPMMQRRRSSAQLRESRARRESLLVERENERIAKINKRMERVHNMKIDPELSAQEQSKIRERRDNMLDMLARQIARIMEGRAKREANALEQEAREIQARLEENLREREEQAENAAEAQPNTPKEYEEEVQAAERSNLKGMLRNQATMGEIRDLMRVRGARSIEAVQLRHAVDSPNSTGFIVTGEGADTITTRVPSGRGETDSFKVNHLRRLETGIARLDEAIMQRVARMYQNSKTDGEAIKAARQQEMYEAGQDENAPYETATPADNE
jgi:hypothetical protein